MRANVPARPRHSAPRYEAAVPADAARARAMEERRDALAREEAARFFCDLRRGLRLARVAVANRLATNVSVIEALETGALDRLPPWPQTVRIVSDYTSLLGLDPRPVLNALHAAIIQHQQLQARQGWMRRQLRKVTALTGTLSAARHERAHALTWAAGLAVPAVLVGSLLLTSGLQASQLAPLASVLGFDRDQAETIKRLEGLKWIDAADPRQRRGDKLPAPGH
jgi:hypothetical protein